MNQYPLNPVDFYEDFLSFLRGIEKYGDKPAITTYTSEKEAVTRSYRQLTEDVYALAAAMREKGWQGWHVLWREKTVTSGWWLFSRQRF